MHPTATSLLSVPEVDAQRLEMDHRSAGEHLKGSTEELQPVSQLRQGPNLKSPVQTHAAWGINKRSLRHAHACRTMISLASQRHGGMVPVTGVLEWKDTGSLGRTCRGDEEGVSPSVSMTSWTDGASTGCG